MSDKLYYYPFTPTEYESIDLVINNFSIKIQAQAIRKMHHLTQEDASAITGISVSTISRIETGGNVSLFNLVRYLHRLGYEIRIVKKGTPNEQG